MRIATFVFALWSIALAILVMAPFAHAVSVLETALTR